MFRDWLEKNRACSEARIWVGDGCFEDAWNKCHRGDWMLWLAAHVIEKKLVIQTAIDCIRTYELGDYFTVRTIKEIEKWCTNGIKPDANLLRASRTPQSDVSISYAYDAVYGLLCSVEVNNPAHYISTAVENHVQAVLEKNMARRDPDFMRKIRMTMADKVREKIPIFTVRIPR